MNHRYRMSGFILPFCTLLALTLVTGCSDSDTNPTDNTPQDTLARVGKRLLYTKGSSAPEAVEWVEADTSRRRRLLGAGWEIVSEPRGGHFVVRRKGSAATSEPRDSLYVVKISDLTMKFVADVRSDSGGTAVLSPDGTRVVVYSGETHEIYIGNSSGGGLSSIAEFAVGGSAPSLDPDGATIAYVYSDWRGQSVHLVNVVGIDDRMLADSAHGGFGGRVSWSPDGTKLAYTGVADGDRPTLFVINHDGTGRRSISAAGSSDFNPEWSPDGTMIAFTSITFGGRRDILLVNADGTGLRAVTSTPARDEDFAHWSPDSKKLLYTAGSGNAASLEVVEIATPAAPATTTILASPVIGRGFWDYTK